MKSILSTALCWLILTSVQAQSPEDFDFWVGSWELSWDSGNGVIGKGTNNIVKILDGKVIQENFAATDAGGMTGFKGTSISVFNPNSKTWRQAWADNQGGYFDFIGEIQGDRKIFKTKPLVRDGKEIIMRMVFYDISQDQLIWDWEHTEDGGQNWTLQWRINYQRSH